MLTTPDAKSAHRRKLLLLGLLCAVFAVSVIDVFVPLLLPEIAKAFHITRAAAASLTAFSALAGVVTGFGLSALSVKINYKILLFFGVMTAPICVLGVYLAQSFFIAQVFYALNGVGSVVVAAMVPTLISELYPLNKKASRISWTVATAWIAVFVASPLTGYLSNSGAVTSWRTSLLWFLLPVTVACAIRWPYLFLREHWLAHWVLKRILSLRLSKKSSAIGQLWLASRTTFWAGPG